MPNWARYIAAFVTFVIDAGPVAALEVEDADRLYVGATAVDAEVTVIALVIIYASAFTIGAGSFVGDADTTVVTDHAWTVDGTVLIFDTRPCFNTESREAVIGVVAVAIGAILVVSAEGWPIGYENAGASKITGIPIGAVRVEVAAVRNFTGPIVTAKPIGAVNIRRAAGRVIAASITVDFGGLEPDGTSGKDQCHRQRTEG